MGRFPTTFVAVALLGGCKPVEPAPEDLDGLAHWFWEELDAGNDPTLAAGVASLQAAVGDDLSEAEDGQLTVLTDADAALVGRAVDASAASGVYVADRVGCSAEGLAAILAYDHQDELYAGVYDAYTRSGWTSVPEYLAGDSDTMSWETEYTVSVVGASYTGHSRTSVRRVRQRGVDEPIVLVRAYLLEPAVFDNPDTENHVDQDYQLEVYWPGDGGLLHVYALWRDLRLAGFDDEGEATQRIILNNLIDWDEATTQLCADGRP